ncbi:ammonium transporter [Cellvibrio zantedeschiae]|uniref:Ammonium transporter n=2 Tax=Cellvibrio zantedeschiae TaxID=1237077 RepID=A0ABQ3BB56_9GAMM|nr:ammonium transporter [Cellvibrio zantedeschiae]GGY82100.1 ammonium transporter [Cellvibrio zantedeschiae]
MKKFVEISRKLLLVAGVVGLMVGAADVFAQDAASASSAAEVVAPAAEVAATPEAAAPAEAAAAPAAPEFNKGDIAWMLTSTLLVLFMVLPGLALFYGGMVRAKNVLSLSMQIFVTFCLISILWAVYGYSLAFTSGSPFIGGLDRLFLKGMLDAAGNLTAAATFSKGIYIPEYLYAAFQMTFAALTPCLIVGAFAERMKFSAVLIFMVLWFTFAYLPIAHMVWFWAGPDAYTTKEAADAATAGAGYIFQMGALDFAGGTVVHINAGIAGLVGCLLIGKRKGYGTQSLAPHNVPFTMIGAALLWVGWFGFNVGSNLEANAFAAQVFINTFLATAAAVLAWAFGEWAIRGKPTMLGAASGAVAGLVAITPACGWVGPMGSIVIGVIGGFVCMLAVLKLKAILGYDDSLDVFGVHCIGGILGALLTGVFNSPDLGGTGVYDYVAGTWGFSGIGTQVWIQAKAVLITIFWSGLVSLVAYKLVDVIVGLRVTEELETEGLDTAEHGERAYHS